MGIPVHVGCCGFRRTRKEYYRSFAAVEVQHTFYDPPTTKTLAAWSGEVSPAFVFSMKAWQLITHAADSPTYKRLRAPLAQQEQEECGYFRPTATVRAALDRTLECAAALGARAIVFQCPPRFVPSDENIENLRSFFSLQRPLQVLYAWEPRGTWPEPLVQELCAELNLVHVVDPFQKTSMTSHAYYYRVMGRRGRGFTFSDEELRELASAIDAEHETYVFFNHLAMLEDAARFQKTLAQTAERIERLTDPSERPLVSSG